MQARINDRLVLEGEVYEPKRGAWTARVEVDADEGGLEGPVTLTIGDRAFYGTATGALEQGRYLLRIVGGADGLKRELDAKYYYQTTVSVVLGDIERETGEQLDVAESDPVVTSALLPRWARLRGAARLALSAVVNETGSFWRVMRNGRVLVRKDEQWTRVAGTFTEVGRDPASGTIEIAPDDGPLAEPGYELPDGSRILEVTTAFDSSSVRQTVVVDNGSGKMRSVAHALTEQARRANEAAINYSQWYPARVVAQDADGTVQLYADDARIRGNGITKVPLRHGIPGLVVKVVPNQRVILFFEDGDPKKPAAGLWPDGSSVAQVLLTAQTRVVFDAPEVVIGDAAAAHRQALGDVLKAVLEQLTVDTAMGPSSTPLNAATFGQFVSTRHKIDG